MPGLVNPNWHEGGHFPPPCPFWIRFCQLNFYQKFPIFLEVKIDINRVNLTPRQAHWVLQKMLLGSAKDEKLSCFLSSCQLGLIVGSKVIYIVSRWYSGIFHQNFFQNFKYFGLHYSSTFQNKQKIIVNTDVHQVLIWNSI